MKQKKKAEERHRHLEIMQSYKYAHVETVYIVTFST